MPRKCCCCLCAIPFIFIDEGDPTVHTFDLTFSGVTKTCGMGETDCQAGATGPTILNGTFSLPHFVTNPNFAGPPLTCRHHEYRYQITNTDGATYSETLRLQFQSTMNGGFNPQPCASGQGTPTTGSRYCFVIVLYSTQQLPVGPARDFRLRWYWDGIWTACSNPCFGASPGCCCPDAIPTMTLVQTA